MDELGKLTAEVDALLARLSPASRRQLAREMGKELAEQTRQRIAAQLNPDGTPYAPRKPRLKGKRGKLRRRVMFSKLRTARLLRMEAKPDAVTLGFTGRVARIASVHQYGLRDRVAAGGREIQYQRRELLGVTPQLIESLHTLIIRHLAV